MNAITFRHVTKRYQMHRNTFRSLSKEFEGWIQSASRVLTGQVNPPEYFFALRDVDFSIRQGESVGIIGANGAGKTTILRLIANITKPTSGKITVSGRVAPLIELGAGFHPELTGRENVFLNGVILGMSKLEISRKFDEIVVFSELEKFIDSPIKQYSSGMYLRLGFSVAIHSNFDILLADEILAVGDQSFKSKCFVKFEEIKKTEKTLIFVSHSIDQLKKHCARGLWFSDGSLKMDGDIASVCHQYLADIK